MKKLVASLATLAFSFAALAADKPKNTILVIADGMGPVYPAAYRNYMDDPKTVKVENTIFDQMLVGMATTYSYGTQKHHTQKTYVTDSAAAATALSTGTKTYNQAVSLDVNNKPLQTMMEFAKTHGKNTGLVVLSQINHATPAAFVAHNTYRYHYNEIADSIYDNRVQGQHVADLMFGGGQQYFIRPDRNIVKQFQADGYRYVDSLSQLGQVDKLPVIGLFGKVDMGFSIDASEPYRLRTMVKKALSLMNKSDKGFFMMIEASLIDWCGHANDVACAMHEVDDLAKVMEYLKQYIDDKGDTLVVATADHNTGGLSIGADGQYAWRPDLIKQVKHSGGFIADKILDGQTPLQAWNDNIGFALKKSQLASLNDVVAQARTKLKGGSQQKEKQDKLRDEAKDSIARELVRLIAQSSLTGWTSPAHTGGDVDVFAYGPGKERFFGHQDNTDIAKQLFNLIK